MCHLFMGHRNTSEFSDVYAMRLISRTSTEFVNIYQISVCILCYFRVRMLFRFVFIKLRHCMAI